MSSSTTWSSCACVRACVFPVVCIRRSSSSPGKTIPLEGFLKYSDMFMRTVEHYYDTFRDASDEFSHQLPLIQRAKWMSVLPSANSYSHTATRTPLLAHSYSHTTTRTPPLYFMAERYCRMHYQNQFSLSFVFIVVIHSGND